MQLLDDYLAFLTRERKKSAATLRAYAADLRGFAAWLAAGDIALPAVRRPQLRAYLVELEEQGLAATSVQRKLASLRGLFRWLQQQGHVDKDPAKLIRGAIGAAEHRAAGPLVDGDRGVARVQQPGEQRGVFRGSVGAALVKQEE